MAENENLDFMKRRENEDFGTFFERFLAGMKKLPLQDIELIKMVMETEKGDFEDTLEKAKTLILIGLGKYSPLRKQNKNGL